MANVYLGLGANLGDRIGNIKEALKRLKQTSGIKIISCSSLYESEAMGGSEQPDFINGVVEIKTMLEPQSLLTIVKKIEREMGREPDSHLQPRPIDIDILLYDNIDWESLELKIPHSRLWGRRFVLEPLLEIAPRINDPASSRSLREALGEVQSQKVEKVMNANEVMDVARRTPEE